MEGAIGFVVFAVVAGVLYVRMLKRRRELLPEQAEQPRVTRRMQRQLEKVREFDQYEPEVPTLEELIAAEVAETGVDDLPGQDGLDTAVKLKVYHRDESVHDGCRDRGLHFAVRDGVAPEDATVADVSLVCDDADHVAPDPRSHEATEEAGPAAEGEGEPDPDVDAGEQPPAE